VVDNLFVASMISRRHRAFVVKVACLVGILYLMGMLRVDRDIPLEEEDRGNAEESDPSGDQSGEIEEPNFKPPKLEPPILELPDRKAAENLVAEQPADPETQSEEKANEKKRLEEMEEKMRLQEKKEKEEIEEKEEKEKKEAKAEEKEKKRLEEKAEEKAEDKELDLVVAPPKMPEGPGEMGKPYKVDNSTLDSETRSRIDKGWLNNAYNEYVSDLISVHRSLPDLRGDWCKEKDRFLENLPPTSVIVCFHNEAWSVLLRSVHSILNRSPEALLAEVILVDDASTMEHLGKDLENYMAQYPKVKIVRAKKREGLIRARLLGAAKALPEVKILTFLDSHIECTPGWLEPLLDRIARDSTTSVCPVIDVIDTETLAYQMPQDNGYFAVGGFDWNLQFNWHAVPEHEEKRRGNIWAPAHSPTMAGGLFAIDRAFFEKLGTYDSGFDIWGAENLELSFKTWMCGGTLEIVPCSHVGHIFRKRSPYKWAAKGNVVQRNSVRLAEVWLDEYKQYYYDRIGKNLGEFGDVESRKQLRKNLQCKSFKWYLDTIFPELFVPGEAVAQGELRNPGQSMCLDSAVRPDNMHKPVGLWPCHSQGGNQYWLLSKEGELRRDEACLDFGGEEVILYPCHGSRGNQWWQYLPENKRMKHAVSRKCLAVHPTIKDKLVMEECSSGVENGRQDWIMEGFNATRLMKADAV